MSRLYRLDECDDVAQVGVLGARLAQLANEELKIVDGFVIPADLHLEDGLSNEVMRYFERLDSEYAVLRPSFQKEEIHGEVLRDVQKQDLLDAIRYARKNAARQGETPAIVIQRDLDAEVSGTVHSINPATGDKNEILIEADLWMNETVLDGESVADMILVNKTSGQMVLESEEEDEICLTPEQIHELYKVVRRVEKRLGFALSLDFAYDHGVLYILRCSRLDDARIKEYTA